ncbi:SRPBCC family protein [Aromatoleum sp.]|uniref:SRPBCC family protein n=1 Tax=Aromatoleum sp. TaxID=2307007 RepID=UPI002FC79A8F
MRSSENRILAVARAFSVGLLAMYLFDPDVGRRRRSLLADKMRKTRRRMADLAEVASRDATNRGRGLRAAMSARLAREEYVSPRTVEERMRARLGRATSNPGALQVRAQDDGTVVLAGPVLASEVGHVMTAAWSVRGVKGVDNRLDVHEQPGNISALQGARQSDGAKGREMTENWPPSVRVLAGAAGAALAVTSLFRRGPVSLVGPVLGGALLLRSAANKSLRETAGFSRRKSVHIDKEIFIAAPPERVFDFWRHQENFPQFMRNVQEVQPAGEDRWHWKVAGPLGPVEWDARIVEREENRRLAWHTLPGTPVESEGRIDFEPEGEGTRLRVSMGYTPVAGALGHAAARLFGRDAKSEMDEDLMRVKSYLETGIAARDAAGGVQRGPADDSRRLH